MFASYGLWFARHAVPEVDERVVTGLHPCLGGFEAVVEDGRTVRARTVVLAVGVLPFTEVPAVLGELSPEHVSHSSDHGDLDRFRGQDVTVIGGGQAALETAALLAEQGTRVRVIARAGELRWNDVPPPWERPWWQSARAPHTGLGCGWRNWFYAERPGAFRALPESTRTRVAATALGPAGAWWVRDRVEGAVELLLGQEVAAAYPVQGAVRLETLDRSGELTSLDTEHVIAATGFSATRDRLGLLAEDLRGTLAVSPDGSPYVGREFETSSPASSWRAWSRPPPSAPRCASSTAPRSRPGPSYEGCGAGCVRGRPGCPCPAPGSGAGCSGRRVTDGAGAGREASGTRHVTTDGTRPGFVGTAPLHRSASPHSRPRPRAARRHRCAPAAAPCSPAPEGSRQAARSRADSRPEGSWSGDP